MIRVERFHIYGIIPIDFWQGWIPVDEFLQRWPDLIEDVELQLLIVKREATRMGWDGHGEICMTGFPIEGGGGYLFGWQQQDNGTSFIVSPIEMPWLEDLKVL